MVQVIGRFRASILRGLPLVKVGLFSGEIYHRFVAQTWKGADPSQPCSQHGSGHK
ncbi:hypothetical protein [Vibrio mimicus]|uniref:hypothetical protein n=1 Tax=Vibrio mimicus TaxID=674 RepID=UPI0012F4FE01|nr:hypothetical protein [Vibrio mimicus]